MGLGAVLTRSSPNVQPATPSPGWMGPTQFMAGPEQQFPSTAILPPPSESQAVSWPAFLRCLSYVSGTVGMLPVAAYRDSEVVDPQPAIIRQPDPNQTPMAYWAGVVESLLLYGNSISIVTSRDPRTGWPATLKPIHPTLAAVRFTGNPMAPTIAAWYIAGQIYDPVDVWHVKSHKGRAGWPLGRGVIDMNGDAIALGLAGQAYAANFQKAGGVPAGILKIHRPEITQQQSDNAKSQWVAAQYMGGVAVLNEMVDYTPVAFRPVDAQMIESRQFDLIAAANMFDLPPSKIGAMVGGGTYKNAQMEEVQSRNDGVMQWTRLLEQAGSLELLPSTQHLQWDMSAYLEADTLSLYQAYQAALGGPGPQSAWMLIDEIRAERNLDPLAVVQAQFDAEIEAAGVTPQQPAQLPPPTTPALPPVVGGPAAGNEPPPPPEGAAP